MIFYGKQTIDKQDIYYRYKALESNVITQGPLSKIFEDNLNEKI